MEQQMTMMKKVWEKETIQNLLKTNDMMVMKSLIELWKKQTHQEQTSESTIEFNGVGFNYVDAPFLTSLAEQADKYFKNEGPRLTQKQIECARKALWKYSNQLTAIANNKI